MEKQPIDNPWYEFARDLFPYTCKKYGLEKVAILSCLIDESEIEPELAAYFHDAFFPLTDEEHEIERQMIFQNEMAYRLLFPEESKKEEELVKNIIHSILENQAK